MYAIEYTGTNRRTFLDERGYVTDDLGEARTFATEEDAKTWIDGFIEPESTYYKITKLEAK